MTGKILVVDDNNSILSALKILLPKYFEDVMLINNPNTLVNEICKNRYDVILLDMNFQAGLNTGNEGFYWLGEIKKYSPSSEVVFFTAYADIDLTVNAIKKGAFDFVVKPWDNAKLISTLMAAYELCNSKKEVKRLKEIKNENKPESEMIWGNTPIMKNLKTLVTKVAKTDASILITGENGTGKDMLAKEIHRISLRNNKSMVTVDIASLPESLFESELFGHVKGSFTDAKNDRAGKFEVADEGTIFLDEIGNIPMNLQSKLLTTIQSKSIVRVGSNQPIPVNIRLITATNKDLEDMVHAGTFREDLLYRINTIHISIPPLRERKEDIIIFAKHFLNRYASKYEKGSLILDISAENRLLSYPWKGNIRELQHTIEKAVILSEGKIISDKDLYLSVLKNETQEKISTPEGTLEEMEKDMIKASLYKNEGNLSLVAQQLGVSRQTLYNKLKKYNLGGA